MAVGAGRNDHIGGRYGNTSGSRSLRQVVGHPPDLFVDGKLQEGAGKIPQNLLFLLPRGTVPQFKLHQRTPTGLSRGQCRFDACSNRGIAPGRSMCIQDEVSTSINGSALSACSLKLLWCDQIRAGASVLDEFRHAHAAVELCDGTDDGFAFGLCLCEPDGILKLIAGNINSGFHGVKVARGSNFENAPMMMGR